MSKFIGYFGYFDDISNKYVQIYWTFWYYKKKEGSQLGSGLTPFSLIPITRRLSFAKVVGDAFRIASNTTHFFHHRAV